MLPLFIVATLPQITQIVIEIPATNIIRDASILVTVPQPGNADKSC